MFPERFGFPPMGQDFSVFTGLTLPGDGSEYFPWGEKFRNAAGKKILPGQLPQDFFQTVGGVL